jgi:pyruvate/2-oxoglutarate dehydrogenase complex dihydrolipoamide dehydrogenase (E3) component
MERYNLVVIGAGSGGLVVAAGAAGLGARVALIEKHRMGGDCLNYGCVPSKAFIKVGKTAHAARTAARFAVRSGLDGGLPCQDLKAAMDYVRSVQAHIAPHDSVERFTGLGVEVKLGAGRLRSPHEVEIESTGEVLWGRHIVIATGSRAAVPPIPGLKEAGYLTNETVFDAAELPRRLLVIGGGPIGLEIGQTFRRLGSEVTVVHDLAHIVPKEDADVAEALARQLRQEGIPIHDEIKVSGVEVKDGEKRVTIAGRNGEETIAADEIFLAAGRRPNIEGLGLDEAGVAYERPGIKVDASCRTNVPSVWAVGDVAGSYQFTHWAGYQARVVIRNTLFPLTAKCDYDNTPWVTFTDPEIGRVGLSEDEAKQKGLAYDVYRVDFEHVDRAVCDGETEGFAKVLTARGTGRLLGAAVVHPHGGELIAELALARKHGLTLDKLSGTIHAYPTLSEVSRALGDAYMRTRLKPGMKNRLTKIYAWLRR